jgi:hypothetical protein
MKKLYLVLIFFAFYGFFVFGNNDMQEEADALLFLPNSSNRFVNEEQAFIQLNKLAQYLSNKNLMPGQIIVYGYAAYAQNDINSVDLSKERALFVMDELQKRGVSKNLFADPVGIGSVYLWGDNANENDKKLNRRVRILLAGESPMPITQDNITAKAERPKAETVNTVIKNPAVTKDRSKESSFKFPWWILALLAFLLFLFFLLLLKGRSQKTVHKKGTANAHPKISKTETVPDFTPQAAVTTSTVNLDEEIRARAYELSRRHNGLGDYREEDWYDAVREISALYTSCGHSVYNDGGRWWASRSFSYDFPATVVS